MISRATILTVLVITAVLAVGIGAAAYANRGGSGDGSATMDRIVSETCADAKDSYGEGQILSALAKGEQRAKDAGLDHGKFVGAIFDTCGDIKPQTAIPTPDHFK